DWSYDLLTRAEQTLFNRLSVFVGGFTLEAAEAVGGARRQSASVEATEQGTSEARGGLAPATGPPPPPGPEAIPPPDVLDLVLRLVDKSLLLPAAGADGDAAAANGRSLESGTPRYRVTETLREYGHERLVAAGEAEEIRRRHLDYALRLVEA